MNLEQIREHVWGAVDQAPRQTEEGRVIVDRFINRALRKMALEAPYCFHADRVSVRAQPDVEPTLDTDTISLAADSHTTTVDPWTFLADLAVGTTDAVEWDITRRWDGRLIVITDGNGVQRVRQIQTVFLNDAGTQYGFTIDRPWDVDNWGSGPFATWRILTRDYFLPPEVVSVDSARVVSEDFGRGDMVFVNQDRAEEQGMVGIGRVSGSGPPRFAWRQKHVQIPGPNTAPDVEIDDPGKEGGQAWMGPEPFGEFEYCFTYSYGKRDTEWHSQGKGYHLDDGGLWENDVTSYVLSKDPVAVSPNRYKEPLFESAPSPVSDAVTVVPPEEVDDDVWQETGAVCITFPNIEFMLGYLAKGLKSPGSTAFERPHHRRSGWHIRLYRRRKTDTYFDTAGVSGANAYEQLGVAMSGQHYTGLQKLDIQDGFYLMAEIALDDLNEGKWCDRGEIHPDYRRRLRNVHGYQGFGVYPNPDGEYELEFRVVTQPEELVSDSDVPPIHEPACEALIQLARAMVCGKINDLNGKNDAMREYRQSLYSVAQEYGDIIPGDEPRTRRAARVHSSKRGRTRLIRQYKKE